MLLDRSGVSDRRQLSGRRWLAPQACGAPVTVTAGAANPHVMEISIVGAGVGGDTSNVFDASTLFTIPAPADPSNPCVVKYSLVMIPNTDPIPSFLSIDVNTGVVTVDVTGTPDYSLTSAGKVTVDALGEEQDTVPSGTPAAPVSVGLTIKPADCNTG